MANLSADPVAKQWTLSELQAAAQNFMIREFGRPIEFDDLKKRRMWHERLGLLVQFTNELWNQDR